MVLSKSVRSLTRSLEQSSVRDASALNRLESLCASSPLREKETELMTEVKNIEVQIKLENKEAEQYDLPDSLKESLSKAKVDVEEKTDMVEPVKQTSHVVQAQRDSYQSMLASLNRKWEDFKTNFESGLKGGHFSTLSDQSSLLEIAESRNKAHGKKSKSMRRGRKSRQKATDVNDVYVQMIANIGALRDSIHGAIADASMDATSVEASVKALLTKGEK